MFKRLVLLALILFGAVAVITAQERTPYGIVNVNLLNVRTAPTTQSAVITQIQLEQTYPITGLSPDGDWWRIRLEDSRPGWVFAAFFTTFNTRDVPVIEDAPPLPAPEAPPPDSTTWPVATDVNVRGGPGTAFNILNGLTAGTRVLPVGRSTTGDWVQIAYQDRTAWIIAGALADDYQDAVQDLPVTTEALRFAQLLGGLNWRLLTTVEVKAGNGSFYPTVGTLLAGDTVRVVGRDWNTEWIRIEFTDADAWVPANALDARYDLSLLPFTPM